VPKSIKVKTKNFCKKIKIKIAITGEMSNGPRVGINLLIGAKMGSVALFKNCTIGLKGSGFTQLINARTRISQYNIGIAISKARANPIKKFPKTNISL